MSLVPKSEQEFVYTFHNELASAQVSGFQLLQKELDQAATQFQGYLGQELSYQDCGDVVFCTANIRFNSLQNCLAWLDSSERRQLLHKAERELSYSFQSEIEPKSFEQWFSSQTPSKVAAWKINLLVWLALYPSVMVLILITRGSIGRLPLPLNMLISNAITVAVTGWFLVPLLSQIYGRWIGSRVLRFNIAGTASILGFLLLFLVLFSFWPGAEWNAS